jgi:hypothetical protein
MGNFGGWGMGGGGIFLKILLEELDGLSCLRQIKQVEPAGGSAAQLAAIHFERERRSRPLAMAKGRGLIPCCDW